MMPHLAEEIYARLFPDSGHLVAELAWPEADPALLVAESVTIAVQVMGKLRGTVEVPPDAAGGHRDRGGGGRAECGQGAGRQARSSSACMCPTGSSTSWSRDEASGQSPSAVSWFAGCPGAPLSGLRLPAGLYADGVRQARCGAAGSVDRLRARSFRNGRGSCCARRCRSGSGNDSGTPASYDLRVTLSDRRRRHRDRDKRHRHLGPADRQRDLDACSAMITNARALTTGSARAIDGVNIFDSQYFAADLETEAEQKRIAENMATQIATQLAVWFRQQAAKEASPSERNADEACRRFGSRPSCAIPASAGWCCCTATTPA